MGIIQAYAIYKYGKRRAEKRQQVEDEFWSEICEHCGYERRQHSNDDRESCPTF